MAGPADWGAVRVDAAASGPAAWGAVAAGDDEAPHTARDTLREVAKAVPRALLEAADTARTLASPAEAFEKGTYQPIAKVANYIKPGVLPSHLIPGVQDRVAAVAPQATAAIARDETAAAIPRYAGAVTEVAANPFTWVGPGGPLQKAGIAVLTGAGGQAVEDVAGEPGRIAAGLALPLGIGARAAIGARGGAKIPDAVRPQVIELMRRGKTLEQAVAEATQSPPAAPPAAQAASAASAGGPQTPPQVPPPPAPPPPPPEAAPIVQTPRGDTGVRLLPADAPHALPPVVDQFAARRSAGAAGTPGTGPLAELSPLARRKLDDVFRQQGLNAATLDQRLEEMSAHDYLGEITHNTEQHMSGLNAAGGGAANEISNSVRQRQREASDRMTAAFDRAFGAYENRFERQRATEISRDQNVRKFWDRFRSTEIAPTPAIASLLPRLEASGALSAANKALAEEGLPARNGFQRLTSGEHIRDNPNIMSGGEPRQVTNVPTAAAFQYAKEFLDDLIEKNLESPGGANAARRYTQLKNDLVAAIDGHPDANVAGLWKDARERYATPTQTITAMKVGERVLTGNVSAEELPFLTASYSPAELKAMQIGMRGRLEDLAGRPGKTDRTVINTVLSRANQAKIRWAIGAEKANELIGAIEHEDRMYGAPNRVIGGSPTAERLAIRDFYRPEPGFLQTAGAADIPHGVSHAAAMGAKAIARRVQAGSIARAEREYERAREELARIFTLQGPERDAVAREVVQGLDGGGAGGAGLRGYARGGRPPVGEEVVVGEEGPEVLVLDKPGTIVPNARTSRRTPTPARPRKGEGSAGSAASGKESAARFFASMPPAEAGAAFVGAAEKFGLADAKRAIDAMPESAKAAFRDAYEQQLAGKIQESGDAANVVRQILAGPAKLEVRVALGRNRADRLLNGLRARSARKAPGPA